MTTTHKPIGTYNLLVMAFLLLFGILLIGFGWRDINNGEAAGFWFFVGWLAFIAAIVLYAFKRKAVSDAEVVKHREATGGIGYTPRTPPYPPTESGEAGKTPDRR